MRKTTLKKYKRKINDVEILINSLEEMLDSRIQMIEEKKYSNAREYEKIYIEKYTPSKQKVKSIILQMISENNHKLGIGKKD